MSTFYVYELRTPDGVVFYVGKGKGNRVYSHEAKARRGVQNHLCHKIRKIWSTGGEIVREIVFRTDNEADAFTEEKRLIQFYGRATLVNQTDGGDGPSNPTQHVRDRIAAGRRGRIASEETRRRLRDSHLGNTHTPETKQKIAATMRGSSHPWAKNSTSNLKTGFLGKKWSDQHRAKFTAARTGHIVSPETREKIRQTKLRKKLNHEK